MQCVTKVHITHKEKEVVSWFIPTESVASCETLRHPRNSRNNGHVLITEEEQLSSDKMILLEADVNRESICGGVLISSRRPTGQLSVICGSAEFPDWRVWSEKIEKFNPVKFCVKKVS